MNRQIVQEALLKIDRELMKAPINSQDLNDVEQALQHRIEFIKQMRSLKVA